ncbi:hypothetical protein NX722_11460 [Endozoicomonas gorgoniicola]|uniref:Uncharacterized protein n=1 Tax=Endozoicomonas gorgoniicola TaxID=1234144 RepID=A0ABT3MV35_9GAMM|nr:hypothetical protein [Endozoicomonas gorgoniicola]MCW7553245.1 hypothetical protein [Endozoicomonas gorgoniicola]
MTYRAVQFILLSFLSLFSLSGFALPVSPPVPPLPEQCKSLYFTSYDDHLRHACIYFYQDEKYKNYKPHVIYSVDKFSSKVTHILKDKANSSSVFFLVNPSYQLEAPLFIDNANVAFVSTNSMGPPANIIFLQPPTMKQEQTGTFFRYDVPGGELLFHSVSFSDDYSGRQLITHEELYPFFTSVIDIKSAKSVKAIDLSVTAVHHQRAVSLDCGDQEEPITSINIVNSRFTIPAKNAYGLSFHCTHKEHTFKVQYAFSYIFLNTSELLIQNHMHLDPLNTNGTLTNPTTPEPTAGTMIPEIPEADIGIFVDVTGNIDFNDSVCNDIQYTDSHGIVGVRSAVREQVLYVAKPETFSGSLSTVLAGTKQGNNYSPEQKSFEMEHLCPMYFNEAIKNQLHYYQPGQDSPVMSQTIYSDYTHSLQEQIEYYKNGFITTTSIAAAELAALVGIAIKFRKPIIAAIVAAKNHLLYKRSEIPLVQESKTEE